MILSIDIVIYYILIGITTGAIYAITGVGLTLILGVARIVNFAHGDFLILGAYATYFLVGMLEIPYFLAIPVIAAVLSVVGIVAEKLTIYPLRFKSSETWILSSLGLSIVIKSMILILFSAEPRGIRVDYLEGVIEILGIRMKMLRFLILFITSIMFVFLHLFIKRTKMGKAMRAVAQNREAAATVGIDAVKINTITFALGTALTGIGGSLIVSLYTCSPAMGAGLLLKAFMIIIAGGIGNVLGAIFSGFLLGVVESFALLLINPEYKDAISFVLLILILAFRPAGVFGKSEE